MKSIKDGVEDMSCGRIGIIGNAVEPRNIFTSITGTDALENVYTVSNDTLRPITDEDEQIVLATLANKVIEKKTNSRLKEIRDSVVQAFRDSSQSNASNSLPNKLTVDDKISNGVKQILTRIKNRTIVCTSKPPTTPALIHTTNHSWEQIKHILPVLITSRSIFLIGIDSANITNQDEEVCRCIAYINSSLSVKASELFKKLPKSKSAISVCPYPRILIVGMYTCDEQHSKTQSTIDSIKKWVRGHCSDSTKHRCDTIMVNTTNQADPAKIQKEVATFIAHDLVIPTPLSWELFRQMFTYVTKNIPILKIRKVAIIASLCDITAEDFPSVLNFFHEHGVFLYYADVECLQNIVILDPKWLQDQLCKIFTPPPGQPTNRVWELLWKDGILVAPLYEKMWQSEEVPGLPTGLAKLLEIYNLVAPIDIDKEYCDFEGTKYFAPFALQSKAMPSSIPMSDGLRTAPLHFYFPVIKYLPLGVFTHLNVALARTNDFKIDFEGEQFSNQVTFWYGNHKRDKVILSATLTSISVVVERTKRCEDEYPTNNLWITCQKVLALLTVEIETVLKSVQIKPAFCCTCLPEGLPHYVTIDLSTESTYNAFNCEKNNEYILNSNEHLWLQMAPPCYKDTKIFESEIDGLLESLNPEADYAKLAEVLEMYYPYPNISFKILVSCWSQREGLDARRHLMFHLKRLGMDEAAVIINKGIFLNKANTEPEHESQGN